MKQITGFIINSMLDVLNSFQDAGVSGGIDSRSELSADQKIDRVVVKNFELIKVLTLAANYDLCLKRAEQQVQKEPVLWEDEEVHNEVIEARVKEWIEENVIHNSKDAVGSRLMDKYDGLIKRHSALIASAGNLSEQMNELNEHSAKLFKIYSRAKKGGLSEKEKAQVRDDLSSLKEALKSLNSGKEVEKLSEFLESRIARVKRISNELNEARNEFQAAMESNFPAICKKEKEKEQGAKEANDQRIADIEKRQDEIAARVEELSGAKQPQRS